VARPDREIYEDAVLDPLPIDPSEWKVVEAFASSRDLQRGATREVMRARRMHGLVWRTRHGVLEPERLQIGDFPDEL
jgi:hypothetical protein